MQKKKAEINTAARLNVEKSFHMDGTSHSLHLSAAELFSILKSNSIADGDVRSSPADSCERAAFVSPAYVHSRNRETHSEIHA